MAPSPPPVSPLDAPATTLRFRGPRASPSLLIGAAVSALVLFVAVLALAWTPHSPTAIAVTERLRPPSLLHPFGTDHFGRDVLSMVMAGARNSVMVALGAVALGMGIGVPMGLAAAVRGGWLDEALMRTGDFVFAFPALVSAVMLTAVFGASAGIAALAIGVFNVPVFARLTRGSALGLWRRDFVAAALAFGRSRTAVALSHVLPNVAGVLIVQATIQFALAILAEAGLSYVGLGTRPPAPSWGRMLAEAQTMFAFAPHLAVFPGLAIALSVFGFNLLGDGLRDALDPRLASRA